MATLNNRVKAIFDAWMDEDVPADKIQRGIDQFLQGNPGPGPMAGEMTDAQKKRRFLKLTFEAFKDRVAASRENEIGRTARQTARTEIDNDFKEPADPEPPAGPTSRTTVAVGPQSADSAALPEAGPTGAKK